MKKILLITAKVVGILVLVILIIAGVIVYKSVDYTQYSLKIDKSAFPDVKTPADIAKLSEKLVSQMSLEEKIDQLYGEKMILAPKLAINFLYRHRFPHVYVGLNERLNIPPWVLSDGPRGARVLDKKIKAVTTFPVAMARGASWDIELEAKINEVIAIEIRANKANYAATPCINLLRHPAWGRAQETYGEDPWLLGEFGLASVNAIQKHNVMACPKHFALNSIENSRWVVNVNADERTLREVYLPHFKKTIQDGKPASLMSAYNKALGEYCGNNKYLLTDILRNEWGFEGFVSSDWISGTYDGVASIQAGLDVEMPWQKYYSYDALEKGIEDGQITEADIDKIVTRSLKTRLKYAFADDIMEYSADLIAQASHIELAREAAEKSMVLLKNENVLPFSKSKNKTIAVIGRLADSTNTGDQGSSNTTSAYNITPYEGIMAYNKTLENNVVFDNGLDIEQAKKIASIANEVILIVGYTYQNEGEYMSIGHEEMEISAKAGKLVGKKGIGGDRENLQLIPHDEKLIKELASTNKNLVVVYIGGSAIDMATWENEVPAILFAWYSGMEGGNALARIIYGDVNPSGKLPFTIAKNQSDYPFFTPYTLDIKYDYYHGYTLFDKKNLEVAYPFGFGLSYTTFEYSNLQITNPIINNNEKLNVTIDITNTGVTDGEEIVQLYIGFKNSSVDRPIKLLRDFKKVLLMAGETKTINLDVAAKDLAWYNPKTKNWEIEAMEYELYIGSSSASKDLLKETFSLQSHDLNP